MIKIILLLSVVTSFWVSAQKRHYDYALVVKSIEKHKNKHFLVTYEPNTSKEMLFEFPEQWSLESDGFKSLLTFHGQLQDRAFIALLKLDPISGLIQQVAVPIDQKQTVAVISLSEKILIDSLEIGNRYISHQLFREVWIKSANSDLDTMDQTRLTLIKTDFNFSNKPQYTSINKLSSFYAASDSSWKQLSFRNNTIREYSGHRSQFILEFNEIYYELSHELVQTYMPRFLEKFIEISKRKNYLFSFTKNNKNQIETLTIHNIKNSFNANNDEFSRFTLYPNFEKNALIYKQDKKRTVFLSDVLSSLQCNHEYYRSN